MSTIDLNTYTDGISNLQLNSLPHFKGNNNEYIINLPSDEEFYIEIKATDNGYMSYSIYEINASKEIKRVINYSNIELIKNDLFYSIIPKITENDYSNTINNGSTVDYKLFANETLLLANDDLRGKSINENYYTVETITNNNNGSAYGAGKFIKGSFSRVYVIPTYFVKFLGWYHNNLLLTTNYEYIFPVLNDITLEARFDSIELYELIITAGTGGSVPKDFRKFPSGTKIEIYAEAEDGYIFDKWVISDGVLESETCEKTIFIMPDSNVTINAFFKPIQNTNISINNFNNPFYDIDVNDWYYNAVINAYYNKHMIGTSKEPMLFSPNAPLSRAMAVTILHRIVNMTKNKNRKYYFNDVEQDMWYYNAIMWAASNKIVKGYNNYKFNPNDNITREELATLLFNFETYLNINPPELFLDRIIIDKEKISTWAIYAVDKLINQGVIYGKENNKFDPTGFATRAEFATILERLLSIL